MTRPKPRRVAVTSPQTRRALAGRRTGHPGAPPPLPAAAVERARIVHRRQLRLALGVLAALAALLIGLPILLAAAPGLDEVRLAGIPLSWLAVAVLPYPVLALLARGQLRRAERVERDGPAERPG
ncbi:MAG TPA: hypothetical protein VNA11_01600 [Pseudonocardia sp.]|nr:hypothetical protein [Pseudonocardia sp.]